MATAPWYCTRESVKRALDLKQTAYADWQVDEAIDAASRSIEQCTNRVFYPWTGTRYFDWPDNEFGTSYTLWLEENELISATTVASGGSNISASQYNLEPVNSAPPYSRVELKLSGTGSFGLSDSRQRDIAITGVFGYANDETISGSLAVALSDTTGVTVSITNPTKIGVGTLLRVDSERMVVTAKSFADSTQNLQADMAAAVNGTSVSVSDGTKFYEGEVILLDAERMLVTAVAGNTLVVNRAWDGTVLATHSGSDVYRQTSLTVERGSVGTTAATHLISASIYLWAAPSPIRNLCRAQAIDTILQEQGGYARTVGSGDSTRNASGAALGALWARVEEDYGRVRLGVV